MATLIVEVDLFARFECMYCNMACTVFRDDFLMDRSEEYEYHRQVIGIVYQEYVVNVLLLQW